MRPASSEYLAEVVEIDGGQIAVCIKPDGNPKILLLPKEICPEAACVCGGSFFLSTQGVDPEEEQKILDEILGPNQESAPEALPEIIPVQFGYHPEAYEELNELQMACGLPTKAEVNRHGMRLLQWYREITLRGAKVLLEEPNGEIAEMSFPSLELPEFKD